MEVIWSAKARITFVKVLDYLNANWTQKELIQFSQRAIIVINVIKKSPEIFPVSLKHKDIRKAIIDSNNVFFYKIDTFRQKIYLLTFFDCRQDPKKSLM